MQPKSLVLKGDDQGHFMANLIHFDGTVSETMFYMTNEDCLHIRWWPYFEVVDVNSFKMDEHGVGVINKKYYLGFNDFKVTCEYAGEYVTLRPDEFVDPQEIFEVAIRNCEPICSGDLVGDLYRIISRKFAFKNYIGKIECESEVDDSYQTILKLPHVEVLANYEHKSVYVNGLNPVDLLQLKRLLEVG